MARKRLENTLPALKSWDDVDYALMRIGSEQRSVEAIEAEMQIAIDRAKKEAADQAEPHKQLITQLEQQINAFTEEHRSDMGDKKSKTLNFGSVGFRKSTKITLPKAKTRLAEIIDMLRGRGMTDCIRVDDPKIDKEALKKYPESDIIAVGAGLKVEDVMWYEVDREKIEQ